jgi:hypothetical protein
VKNLLGVAPCDVAAGKGLDAYRALFAVQIFVDAANAQAPLSTTSQGLDHRRRLASIALQAQPTHAPTTTVPPLNALNLASSAVAVACDDVFVVSPLDNAPSYLRLDENDGGVQLLELLAFSELANAVSGHAAAQIPLHDDRSLLLPRTHDTRRFFARKVDPANQASVEAVMSCSTQHAG